MEIKMLRELIKKFEEAVRFAYTPNKYGFLKLESRLPKLILAKQELVAASEVLVTELEALKKEYNNLSRSAQEDFKYSRAMKVLTDPVTSAEVPFKVIKVHECGTVDILEPEQIIEEILSY